MTRKEFIGQVGTGAAFALIPACLSSLSGCTGNTSVPAAPTNVDFTLDVSSGTLATNGNYLVTGGLVVARTTSGTFLAVSAACTHEGATIQYVGGSNSFYCPRHGARFSSSGTVTNGPASQSLTVYNTALTGTSLRVYS